MKNAYIDKDKENLKEFNKINKGISISEEEMSDLIENDSMVYIRNYFLSRVNAITKYRTNYFIHASIVEVTKVLTEKMDEEKETEVINMYKDMISDLPYLIADEIEFKRGNKKLADSIRYFANNNMYQNEIDQINEKIK